MSSQKSQKAAKGTATRREKTVAKMQNDLDLKKLFELAFSTCDDDRKRSLENFLNAPPKKMRRDSGESSRTVSPEGSTNTSKGRQRNTSGGSSRSTSMEKSRSPSVEGSRSASEDRSRSDSSERSRSASVERSTSKEPGSASEDGSRSGSPERPPSESLPLKSNRRILSAETPDKATKVPVASGIKISNPKVAKADVVAGEEGARSKSRSMKTLAAKTGCKDVTLGNKNGNPMAATADVVAGALAKERPRSRSRNRKTLTAKTGDKPVSPRNKYVNPMAATADVVASALVKEGARSSSRSMKTLTAKTGCKDVTLGNKNGNPMAATADVVAGALAKERPRSRSRNRKSLTAKTGDKPVTTRNKYVNPMAATADVVKPKLTMTRSRSRNRTTLASKTGSAHFSGEKDRDSEAETIKSLQEKIKKLERKINYLENAKNESDDHALALSKELQSFKEGREDGAASVDFTEEEDIPITTEEIHRLNNRATSHSNFVGLLLTAIVGPDELLTMSATGQPCRRFLKKTNTDGTMAYPPTKSVDQKVKEFLCNKVAERVAIELGPTKISAIRNASTLTKINEHITTKIANLKKAHTARQRRAERDASDSSS